MPHALEDLEARLCFSTVASTEPLMPLIAQAGAIAVRAPLMTSDTPAAPSELTAQTPVIQDVTQIEISWKDNSGGEASFEIFRALGTGAFVQIATVASSTFVSPFYVDNALAAGKTYSYEVRAINGAAVSGFSNVATATTPTVPPGDFTVDIGADAARTLNYMQSDGTHCQLSWRGPGDAVLSFEGGGLSESTRRGKTLTANVKGKAYLDYFIAENTSSGTSIDDWSKGGAWSNAIAYVAIDGPIGKFDAPATAVGRAISITGNVGTLNLFSAEGCDVNAPFVHAAYINGTYGSTLDFDSIGTFRSDFMSQSLLQVSGTLANMVINGDFELTNVIAPSIGRMKLGKVSEPYVGTPFGITLTSASLITGSIYQHRFTLRNISSGDDITALLAQQKVSTDGDFYIV